MGENNDDPSGTETDDFSSRPWGPELAAIRPRLSARTAALVIAGLGATAAVLIAMGDSAQASPWSVFDGPAKMELERVTVDEGEIDEFLEEHLENGDDGAGKMGGPTAKGD